MKMSKGDTGPEAAEVRVACQLPVSWAFCVMPPFPEWGAMIAEGRQYLLLAWWMTTLPGLALLVVGVALSLIGDGLAERRGG